MAMKKNQEKPLGETNDFLTWAALKDSTEAKGNICTLSQVMCIYNTNDITIICVSVGHHGNDVLKHKMEEIFQ